MAIWLLLLLQNQSDTAWCLIWIYRIFAVVRENAYYLLPFFVIINNLKLQTDVTSWNLEAIPLNRKIIFFSLYKTLDIEYFFTRRLSWHLFLYKKWGRSQHLHTPAANCDLATSLSIQNSSQFHWKYLENISVWKLKWLCVEWFIFSWYTANVRSQSFSRGISLHSVDGTSSRSKKCVNLWDRLFQMKSFRDMFNFWMGLLSTFQRTL
jgi:hypothetical protein